jgi:hypothetical protein
MRTAGTVGTGNNRHSSLLMDVALPLIGLGTAIVVAVLVIWAVEKFKRPPPPPPEPLPTFRVIALGLEGAGKTVLLASQFHKLSGPAADRRYFLDGDFRQDQFLAWIYGHVSDTTVPWPPGSQIGATREFLFDCKAYDGAGVAHTVFRISYLDYAGDLLEPRDSEHEALAEIEARVKDAHALLVIVDGRRVLQLLRGEPEGHDYFDRRLHPLLRLAGRVSCPVQLLLTKWDLVRAFGAPADDDEARLRQVRDLLTDYGSIEHLVHGQGRHQKEVRLIPVSAVGPEFAELCEDGTVVKRQDGTLDPIHIDVPLCAVLPDVLKHVERSLERKPDIRRALDAELGRSRRRDVPSIVHSVLISPAGMLLRKTLTGVVGDEVVKLFVEMLASSRSREAEPLPRDDDIDDGEADAERLRATVIEHMERVVLLFEARLPSSILRSRW